MYLVCAKQASINLIHSSIKLGSHPTGLLLSSHWVGKWINQILAPLQTIANSVMNESELWVGTDSLKLQPSIWTQQQGNLGMQSTQRGIATLMKLRITWDAHGGHIVPMDKSVHLHTQAFPRDLVSEWELNVGPSYQWERTSVFDYTPILLVTKRSKVLYINLLHIWLMCLMRVCYIYRVISPSMWSVVAICFQILQKRRCILGRNSNKIFWDSWYNLN